LHLYDTIVVLILVFVLAVVYVRCVSEEMLFNKYTFSNIEFVWTVGPVAIIITCTVPRFIFLYRVEGNTVGKVYSVIRNQWYWQYGECGNIYDSIFSNGNLTTVSQCSLSGEKSWSISSNDVIHNWGIAGVEEDSLSMKMDAYPRRINYASIDGLSDKKRIYFRYCSELCGTNHAYMPISLVM